MYVSSYISYAMVCEVIYLMVVGHCSARNVKIEKKNTIRHYNVFVCQCFDDICMHWGILFEVYDILGKYALVCWFWAVGSFVYDNFLLLFVRFSLSLSILVCLHSNLCDIYIYMYIYVIFVCVVGRLWRYLFLFDSFIRVVSAGCIMICNRMCFCLNIQYFPPSVCSIFFYYRARDYSLLCVHVNYDQPTNHVWMWSVTEQRANSKFYSSIFSVQFTFHKITLII